tara:strand:- start:21063 stop:21716 length:654 start_codon:yes stop_codon:yes gene_type:complete
MNSAIILAGGVGKRFNNKTPKQFLKINDEKLMIEYSIDKFSNNNNINEIILVVHKDWFDLINKKYKNYKIVIGGDNRFSSSYIGLQQCSKNSKHVFIHDAARPLISHNLINDGLAIIKSNDAAIPILDINESLLYHDTSNFHYLDREKIKIIQTPQIFKFNIIKEAYKNTVFNEKFTDDLSVLIDYNNKIKTIFYKGCINNIKVTYNNDFEKLNTIK